MSRQPYISIVMPVKNREQLIGSAIKSIINQTFSDWELIVVNDHSTDQTKKKTQAFQDARIRIFDLPSGKTGIPVARHFGNQRARGDVIVVADSDDENYPFRLEETRTYFRKNQKADVFYGNIDVLFEQSGVVEARPFQPFSAELLWHINYIPNPAAAYKATAYRRVAGYDARLHLSSDYDLWLQMLEAGMQFGWTRRPLVCYRRHTASSSAAQRERRRHREMVHQKHGIVRSEAFIQQHARPIVYQFFKSRGWFRV